MSNTVVITLIPGQIFVRCLENTLAFNEYNGGKSFEFTGDITEIKTSMMGYSVITFKIIGENDEPLGQVNCLNCHKTRGYLIASHSRWGT